MEGAQRWHSPSVSFRKVLPLLLLPVFPGAFLLFGRLKGRLGLSRTTRWGGRSRQGRQGLGEDLPVLPGIAVLVDFEMSKASVIDGWT